MYDKKNTSWFSLYAIQQNTSLVICRFEKQRQQNPVPMVLICWIFNIKFFEFFLVGCPSYLSYTLTFYKITVHKNFDNLWNSSFDRSLMSPQISHCKCWFLSSQQHYSILLLFKSIIKSIIYIYIVNKNKN